MTSPCPVCRSTTAPKFSPESDWCASCSGEEVRVQRKLDKPTQSKQIVERDKGIREVL